MTTVFLAPTFGAGFQSFLDTGGINSNGFIQTYAAGSSTPQATYTTSGGTVANPVPPTGIQLGVNGRPPNEIWLVQGQSYKFIVTDQYGNLLTNGTFDNLSGINDISAQEPFSLAQGGTGTTTGFGLTIPCGISGGTANALTLTPNPPVTSYGLGQEFIFSALHTNTGSCTVNISGVGVTYISSNFEPLQGGEILATIGYRLIGDGVGFVLEPLSSGGIVDSYVGLTLAGVQTGTANALTMTVNPPWYGYLCKYQRIFWQATATNTGAATVIVTGSGLTTSAIAIQYANNALTGGEIVSGSWCEMLYDGTNWQLMKWQPNTGTGTALLPYYVNSWTNFGGSDQVGMVFKDALGFVHLTGVLTGGTTPSNICTLPAGKGLWPNALIGFGCLANNEFGGFTVSASGVIAATTGSGTGFGLDGASWFGNVFS
jgi:hypothetical protein